MCVCVCVCVFVSVSLYVCVSLCISLCVPLCVCVSMCVCLSLSLSLCLSMCVCRLTTFPVSECTVRVADETSNRTIECPVLTQMIHQNYILIIKFLINQCGLVVCITETMLSRIMINIQSSKSLCFQRKNIDTKF